MNGIRNTFRGRCYTWRRLAPAVVAVGLLASACGHSSSHSSAPTTTGSGGASTTSSAPASTTTAAAPTTTTTTTAPTSTTTAPATTTTLSETGKGACPSAALSVRIGAGNGAAGSEYYTVTARNIGSVTCNVGGYFGVSVWDRAGHLLSADDQRQAETPSGQPVGQVALAPGGYASFTMRLVDATCNTSSPQIGAFHFIPPNDTTFDQVSESKSFAYCGDGISVYPTIVGRKGGT